jgi:hypothetical protein
LEHLLGVVLTILPKFGDCHLFVLNVAAMFQLPPKGISNIANTPIYYAIFYGRHEISRTPNVPKTTIMDWYINPDPGKIKTGISLDGTVDLSKNTNFAKTAVSLKCREQRKATWSRAQEDPASTTMTYCTSGYK